MKLFLVAKVVGWFSANLAKNTGPLLFGLDSSLMRRFVLLPALLCVAGIAIGGEAAPSSSSDKAAPSVEKSSQVTKSLLTPTAWTIFGEGSSQQNAKTWQFTNGILICKGTPKGYLATRKSYTDFVLQLEWRWPPKGKPGNGGVLIRKTGKDKVWPKCLEAQINVNDAGDFWAIDGYHLIGPSQRTEKLKHPQFGKLIHVKKTKNLEKPAGQWNRYVIRAQRGTVTLTINGQEVNKATDCDVVPGPVLLTAEGDEIHFRNIRITPLKKK